MNKSIATIICSTFFVISCGDSDSDSSSDSGLRSQAPSTYNYLNYLHLATPNPGPTLDGMWLWLKTDEDIYKTDRPWSEEVYSDISYGYSRDIIHISTRFNIYGILEVVMTDCDGDELIYSFASSNQLVPENIYQSYDSSITIISDTYITGSLVKNNIVDQPDYKMTEYRKFEFDFIKLSADSSLSVGSISHSHIDGSVDYSMNQDLHCFEQGIDELERFSSKSGVTTTKETYLGKDFEVTAKNGVYIGVSENYYIEDNSTFSYYEIDYNEDSHFDFFSYENEPGMPDRISLSEDLFVYDYSEDNISGSVNIDLSL